MTQSTVGIATAASGLAMTENLGFAMTENLGLAMT